MLELLPVLDVLALEGLELGAAARSKRSGEVRRAAGAGRGGAGRGGQLARAGGRVWGAPGSEWPARLVSSCAAVLSWSRFDFLCAFSRVDSFSVLSLAFSRSSAWRASSSERVCSTSSTLAWLCWAYFWYIAARFSLSCASVRMNCSASVLLPSSCCI